MTTPERTLFYQRHVDMGARMVAFGGWEMPIQYARGIVHEHLATRRHAGIFDVSHMGRFRVAGRGALAFLQHALSNNAAALEEGQSQYTLIPDAGGGALDDAYLYRFLPDEYLLVVNAANRAADWRHLEALRSSFTEVVLEDRTDSLMMLSLQGPRSKEILAPHLDGALPEPMRNYLSTARVADAPVQIARTGYTGEPLCFELFIPRQNALAVWDRLTAGGAEPVGLGARDTLRLEAGLPLYGHEMGADPEGRPIPIFASPLARFAVSFSPLKGDFVGRAALQTQFRALKRTLDRDHSLKSDLPRLVRPVHITGRGIARAGDRVLRNGRPAGWVTSGTMVPFWQSEGEGIAMRLTGESGRRAIALALVDSGLYDGDGVEIEVRGRRVPALIVPYHLRSEAPPMARPILCHEVAPAGDAPPLERRASRVGNLVRRAVANHRWRQQECINLIPSEQTLSPMARLLSISDPVGRYAEHKTVKAFCEAEVFYYQGTDFIGEVERLLEREMRVFLGAAEVETRPLSGQMANTTVFSAMVDFLNRADRKSEQRRIGKIFNNHIIKGGHLSAQPMGALRDFVARDPQTERPAVVNFPVMENDAYRIDTAACRPLMEAHRPELVILGKSMTLYPEPVAEMRAMIAELELDCVLHFDAAHVLGLLGPHFQQPFAEGADLVTGSTHKTYFGTQRGVVAADVREGELYWELWEAIRRRAFPGSVSNHHLGTQLGLLMAAYEMNAFRDDYQPAVLQNARAFAAALADCGLDVAGDPDLSYTATHQVILNVGYARGPEIARRLEENNIILNYQAAPEEEGFTASGSLRMGVAEMTRFGMGPEDFRQLAELTAAVLLRGKTVRDEVARLRRPFDTLRYCFAGGQFDDLLQELHGLI